MTGPVVHIGVDVSKDILELTGFDRGARQVPNTAAGIRRFIKRIDRLDSDVRVCCEATGGYEARLCSALLVAEIPIARINPHRSRHFACSKGLFAKTDRIDAQLLAEFSSVQLPRLLRPPAPWREELRALCLRRHTLMKMIIQEGNRLDPPPPPVIAKDIRSHIRLLQGRKNKVEQAMFDMRKREPEIKTLCVRLELIQGIGPVISISLVALLPELGELRGNEIAALAGLAPYNDDSGKHSGKRNTRAGRVRVKAVLYMGAMSAIQYNPVLSVFYQRLLDAGKEPMVALTAVMRKMIRLANRVIADPDFVPQGAGNEKRRELSIGELAVENGTINLVGGRRSTVGNSRKDVKKPLVESLE